MTGRNFRMKIEYAPNKLAFVDFAEVQPWELNDAAKAVSLKLAEFVSSEEELEDLPQQKPIKRRKPTSRKAAGRGDQ